MDCSQGAAHSAVKVAGWGVSSALFSAVSGALFSAQNKLLLLTVQVLQ